MKIKVFKPTELLKAKYTKRTGSPGNYQYEYGEKKGRPTAKPKAKLGKKSKVDKFKFDPQNAMTIDLGLGRGTERVSTVSGKAFKAGMSGISFVVLNQEKGGAPYRITQTRLSAAIERAKGNIADIKKMSLQQIEDMVKDIKIKYINKLGMVASEKHKRIDKIRSTNLSDSFLESVRSGEVDLSSIKGI